MCSSTGMTWLGSANPMKSARDQPRALVDQLVERVLAVGARLAPEDLPGERGDRGAVAAHRLAVALHRQLLQVGGQPVQVLAVGQHGVRLRAEEVDVPDVEQALDDRQVLLERRGAEVPVDGVHAREELAELLLADRDHEGEADRGVDRVAPAHPVPEAEHVGLVDAERRDLLGVRRHRHEVLGDRLLARRRARRAASRGRRAALVSVSRVVNVLDETMNSVVAGSRSRSASETSVGSMLETKRIVRSRSRVVLQRLVGHDGAEVRAADADVDDGRGSARRCGPSTPRTGRRR